MKFVARLLACLFLFAGQALQVRADSDKFAEATDLAAFTLPYIGFVGGSGTAEVGEPAHAGSPAAHSYWFQWKAPASSPCIFREYVNGSASRIAIYTGDSLTSLTLVAQGVERVFFAATEGVIYRIAIDSPTFDVVQFKPYPVGGGDEIASATPITGSLPLRVNGNNALATAAPTDEDWHPDFHPKATVWWLWTAPASGAIRLDARYCDFSTRLTAYERAPGDSPVRSGAGFETTGMPVKAGYDYLFCIDSVGDPGEIGFWLEWFPTTAPPNDNIANATDLGSPRVACDGEWIYYATPEAGAPNEDLGYPQWGIPGDHTLWWKWTCPQSGTYRFSQLGSDGSAAINVYTGTPGALSIIAGLELPEGVRIPVTTGTTYWIQIKDWKKTALRAELNIHPAATEPRYFTNFANRGVFRLYGPQRHPDADPDGDGFSNEIEFACASNPEVYDPNDPNLPHLLPHTSGGWKLQWDEDTTYLTSTPGEPISLAGKFALDLAGPWTNPGVFRDPVTNRRLVVLPTATRAFARLELNDPNWDPAP
jgi:hypothetical protein